MKASIRDPDILLTLFLRAAREARKAILSKKGLKKIVREKQEDVTRLVDVLSEKIIVKSISSRAPCLIISEEMGASQIGSSPEFVVVLDPLDGTTNFANSIPFYSISLSGGVYSEPPRIEDLIVGVVLDLVSGEAFFCRKGRPVRMGGGALTRRYAHRDETLISLYAYGRADRDRALSLQAGFPEAKFRALGSAALELCYVAARRLDAFVDIRDSLRLVDVAAGKIILEESGGLFTDLEGKEMRGKVEDIRGMSVAAASDAFLHRRLLQSLGTYSSNISRR